MKTFSDGRPPVNQGLAKCLSDVIRVNVVYRLEPKIRERQRFALSQRFKYCRIEMPRRVQRVPPRTDNVSRVQNRYREIVRTRLLQEVSFDRGLFYAILAKWSARLFLGRGYQHTWAMDPDRSAVQEMLNFSV